MKKVTAWLCLVALLSLFLAGCHIEPTPTSPPKNYEAFAFGNSDSFGAPQLASEYELIDYSVYSNDPPSQEYEITLKGATYKGVYTLTQDAGYCYYPQYWYVNYDTRVTFTIDPNGNITTFCDSDLKDHAPLNDPCSVEECVEAAKNYLSEFVDVSLYSIEVSELNDNRYYDVTFQKYIDGIQTLEMAKVCVLLDGRVSSFYSTMLGKIPANTRANDIDMDAVYAALYAKLDALFAESKEHFTVIYNERTNYLTILKDGSRGFIANFGVECRDYHEYGGYGLWGYSVNIVVPIP